jgi:hypothetical protein
MLTMTGRAEEHHVVAGGDEVQGAQVGDGVALEGPLVFEIELFQAFAGGKPGGADPSFAAWASRAATSRCRQAARYSSCDQSSARARSASRATAAAMEGAFSARAR